LPGFRVSTGNVSPLGTIAVKTGKSQIGGLGLAPVFLGDDVIDFKWNGRGFLRQMTILGAVSGMQ
jgi:hypothetical protein